MQRNRESLHQTASTGGYAYNNTQIDHFLVTEDLFSKLFTSSHILADCVLFLTILSTGYLIYRTVYKYARCKQNPVYGLYCSTILFSIDVFLITVTIFEPDAIMQPQLITFLILEFIVSVLIVCRSKSHDVSPKTAGQNLGEKVWVQGYTDFPIPLVPAKLADDYSHANRTNNEQKMSEFTRCVSQPYCAQYKQQHFWFPVAFSHAFAVDRVELLITFPLETFVEFVLYLIPLICVLVVSNLPFYYEEAQYSIQSSWQRRAGEKASKDCRCKNPETLTVATLCQSDSSQPGTLDWF